MIKSEHLEYIDQINGALFEICQITDWLVSLEASSEISTGLSCILDDVNTRANHANTVLGLLQDDLNAN